MHELLAVLERHPDWRGELRYEESFHSFVLRLRSGKVELTRAVSRTLLLACKIDLLGEVARGMERELMAGIAEFRQGNLDNDWKPPAP